MCLKVVEPVIIVEIRLGGPLVQPGALGAQISPFPPPLSGGQITALVALFQLEEGWGVERPQQTDVIVVANSENPAALSPQQTTRSNEEPTLTSDQPDSKLWAVLQPRLFHRPPMEPKVGVVA